MGHTKVFVGNLSFKTRASELAAEFGVAGKVISAKIISRGPRSLGYGFVELESEEEAQKAVSLLNKKSIDQREINVEIARPQDEAKIAEKREAAMRGGRGGRGGGRGGRGRGGRGRGRGRFWGRGRGGFPRGNDGGDRPQSEGGNVRNQAQRNQNQVQSQVQGEGEKANQRTGGAGGGGPGRRRRFRPRNQGDTDNNKTNTNTSLNANNQGRRQPRRNRPENQKSTPSQTTLFVTNLPFAVDDAGLTKIFEEFGPKKAYVVRSRFGLSKGFGFVEFENETQQQEAMARVHNQVVEKRPLVVKIALNFEKPNNNNNDTPTEESSTATTTTTTTTTSSATTESSPPPVEQAQPTETPTSS